MNNNIITDKIVELKYTLEDGRYYIVTPGKFITGIAEIKITDQNDNIIIISENEVIEDE